MKEEWKDIEGYEHAYQISNLGRVRSKQRLSKAYHDGRSSGHVVKERIRTPSTKNGYPFLWLYDVNGGRKMHYVHRLVAEHFLGNTGSVVDHIDRDRQNNVVTNLRWVNTSCNLRNRSNTSGYYWHRKNKVYVARIKVNKKTITLGYYATANDAHDAYQLAQQQYFDVS